ncbi:hypothetical protein [Bailinhaonella thermotolerans]|uniref:Uncharacterized protein n=1 Tax=Bailinhaonella thermotolerans TaxID=1070861 RepID=A0A3A4AWY8_9ACTN|nr:hypothetical protein [Bailinhaonella thermotolerans]RJL23942.1 hypothetical protein D5H75_31385 [Bailinhaonella thermotolerans]
MRAWSDAQLREVAELVRAEQVRRAVLSADPEALCEAAFADAFTHRGIAGQPYLAGGILVCPGSIRRRSATSHDCVFAHVDDHWCWEHPDVLLDEVRKLPDKGKEHQRSVTLIPVADGQKVDVIAGRMTQGAHRATSVTSYQVDGDRLKLVQARTPRSAHGRGR